MRTAVPEKLLKICDDIAERGDVPLTRLTVLKAWLAQPGRLPGLAVFIASRASSRKGKITGPAAQLFKECRALLAGVKPYDIRLDRPAAKRLHAQLRDFQNEYDQQRWGPMRKIKNWNLLLVEESLSIYLSAASDTRLGYKLAADYCQNYDSRYGNGLNGPSATKIEEIVRFMFVIEAREEDNATETEECL